MNHIEQAVCLDIYEVTLDQLDEQKRYSLHTSTMAFVNEPIITAEDIHAVYVNQLRCAGYMLLSEIPEDMLTDDSKTSDNLVSWEMLPEEQKTTCHKILTSLRKHTKAQSD